MTDITPERLAEIKVLVDKATAGPWQTTYGTTESLLNPYSQSCRKNAVLIDGRHLLNLWGTPNPDENAAFIAAARQDIPDIIAALEAAQAENANLRAILSEAVNSTIRFANITEANVSEKVWKQIIDATTAALEQSHE